MNSKVRIERLVLNNYRNHKFLSLDISKDIIVIYGKNGSGKTNILESISLFDSYNGLRNSKFSEIIKEDIKGPLELFGVNLSIFSGELASQLGLGFRKDFNNFKKIFSVNGKRTNTVFLKNLMNVFWIVPRMTYLFQNSPEERRSFIDLMISSIDASHKKKLVIYEKYKQERIKILKNQLSRNQTDWLDIIEKKMASVGIMLCDSRRSFLKTINANFQKINSDMPQLKIEFNGELDEALLNQPALEVEELFYKNLKKNRKKDFLTGRTNFGANKTDLLVYDIKDGREAKKFSTGEQKLIVLSLVFSFIKYLKINNLSNVIFLLDDIFSYLDIKFIFTILEKLNDLNIQTWITDVRGDWVLKNNRFYTMIDKINIDDKRFKVVNNRLY